MRKNIIIFIGVFFLCSCTEPEQLAVNEYYDLSSFWKGEIKQLEKSEFKFHKVAKMNGEENELDNFSPNWARELELFMATDLNKSAYLGAYQEEKQSQQIAYNLKPGFEHPVKSLKITLQDDEPIKIQAEMVTSNFLYESERSLQAEFDAGVLKSYHIQGSQSLFIGSVKNFDISVSRL